MSYIESMPVVEVGQCSDRPQHLWFQIRWSTSGVRALISHFKHWSMLWEIILLQSRLAHLHHISLRTSWSSLLIVAWPLRVNYHSLQNVTYFTLVEYFICPWCVVTNTTVSVLVRRPILCSLMRSNLFEAWKSGFPGSCIHANFIIRL